MSRHMRQDDFSWHRLLPFSLDFSPPSIPQWASLINTTPKKETTKRPSMFFSLLFSIHHQRQKHRRFLQHHHQLVSTFNEAFGDHQFMCHGENCHLLHSSSSSSSSLVLVVVSLQPLWPEEGPSLLLLPSFLLHSTISRSIEMSFSYKNSLLCDWVDGISHQSECRPPAKLPTAAAVSAAAVAPAGICFPKVVFRHPAPLPAPAPSFVAYWAYSMPTRCPAVCSSSKPPRPNARPSVWPCSILSPAVSAR